MEMAFSAKGDSNDDSDKMRDMTMDVYQAKAT